MTWPPVSSARSFARLWGRTRSPACVFSSVTTSKGFPTRRLKARGIIFPEPNADVLYDENLPQMDAHLLAVEYLPGQYDQRADSAAQCLQLLSPDQARPKVVCAKVYAIEGEGVTR